MKRFLILLSIFLCIGCAKKIVTKHVDTIEEVSYSSIYKIINHYDLYKDIDLIDVRDEDCYSDSHFIGARNIPYSELIDAEFDSNKRIIVYGDNRSKSIAACRKLRSIGIDADYVPGINNYPYELV